MAADRTEPPPLWAEHALHWLVHPDHNWPKIGLWKNDEWRVIGTSIRFSATDMAAAGWRWHSPAMPFIPLTHLGDL